MRPLYAFLIGTILTILALAQRLGGYENKPLAVALVVLAGALLIYTAISLIRDWVVRHRQKNHGARLIPTIEDFEVKDALNLRVTNNYAKDGLADDVLFLHSIKLWNPGRKQFEAVEFLSMDGPSVKMPLHLTNDHPGLPYQEPRIFQLVQFTERAAPFVHGSGSDHKYVKFFLRPRGFWEFSMELRWAGDSEKVVRVFHWGENSLPKFCKRPS